MKNTFSSVLQEAYSLAAKIVNNTNDAQDIIQDAATVALSHNSAPKQTSEAFKPWFFRVVRNKAIDNIRATNRQTKRNNNEPDNDIDKIQTQHTDPEQTLVAEQTSKSITKALSQLSVEHREIVLLKDYHDFTYTDIALVLDIPKGSVMSRLHRARLALKEAYFTINQTQKDDHNE